VRPRVARVAELATRRADLAKGALDAAMAQLRTLTDDDAAWVQYWLEAGERHVRRIAELSMR
jgi:hypothetical protein